MRFESINNNSTDGFKTNKGSREELHYRDNRHGSMPTIQAIMANTKTHNMRGFNWSEQPVNFHGS